MNRLVTARLVAKELADSIRNPLNPVKTVVRKKACIICGYFANQHGDNHPYGRYACKVFRPKKKSVPEDLSVLTDEALEQRIFYSQDNRSGEPFFPLWDEYKKRYNKKKKECGELRNLLTNHNCDWELEFPNVAKLNSQNS